MSKKKTIVKALGSVVTFKAGDDGTPVDNMPKEDKQEFNKMVCVKASLRMSDYFSNDKSGWDDFINVTYK